MPDTFSTTRLELRPDSGLCFAKTMSATPKEENDGPAAPLPAAADPGPAPVLPPDFLQRLSLRPTRMRWAVHVFMFVVLSLVLPLYFRYRVRGRRHIPRSGPVLIVVNHASHLDPLLIGAVCCRRMFRYMAKEDLWRGSKAFRFMMENLGAFPVRRGAADRDALRYASELLEAGQALVVFPEGTRTRDGSIGDAQPGVAMILSKHPDVPILPLRIDGAFEAFGSGMRFPAPHRIAIAIGPTFTLAHKFREKTSRKQLYREIGDEVMVRIRQARP
ncbi:MAG: 1-acyl-sn-glycerol-3-phosphate acyltransferase [Opitutae bacterium]|nr:1-acyl-sn-glycerol-3-phosphate acyltransferase [Opitutae bacterium]